jgi:hypothetical protein
VTDLFWGFATSADTIEDRSSDWFGILLGTKMREYGNNGRIVDFFVEKWPKLVKEEVLGAEKVSGWRRIYEVITSIIELIRYRIGTGAGFDLPGYMKDFFEKYGAVDPRNPDEVPPGLLEKTIRFYIEKYNSDEWDKYAARQWEVVIPQELWERVGRDKWTKAAWTQAETELPIKIQLNNGEKVEPYFRED